MDMDVPYRFSFCKCSSFTGFKILGSVQTAEELDQFGNQACPAGLVARPQPSARCLRGSTRRTGCNPSIEDRSGITPCLHTPAAGQTYRAGSFESTDWQFLVPLQTDSSFCPSRWTLNPEVVAAIEIEGQQ